MSRPRLPLRLMAVCGLGLASTLACGSSDGMSSYSSRSKTAASTQGPESFEAADRGYVVPPDRALMRVRISAEGEGGAAARGALSGGIADVQAAARSGGCAATIAEYTTPRPGGWDGWKGNAELRVEVDLREATDVAARIAAVDACLGSIAELAEREGEDVQADIALSGLMYSLDDPDGHAAALWARHGSRLARVSAAAGAPQQHPEDLRCTTTGEVSITARSISGIGLALDVSCRAVTPPSDAVADAG